MIGTDREPAAATKDAPTPTTTAVGPPAAEERRRERPAARHRSALVGEPAARLRADDPLPLPALLADASRRQRPERAGIVRPLARASIRTVGGPSHVRGRGGHR